MAYSYYDWVINYYYEYIGHNDTTWCYNLTHHNTTYNDTYHNTHTSSNETFTINNTTSWTIAPTQFYTTTFFNCSFPPREYTHQQWWYNGIDETGKALTISAFIVGTISLVITAFFFKELHTAFTSKKKKRPNKITVALSSSCMVVHTVYTVASVFQHWFWFFDYNEDIYLYIDIIWELFWMSAKVMIYSLFAYRYYLILKASVNKKHLKQKTIAIFGMILIAILAQIAMEIIYAVYYWDHLTTGWDDVDFEEKQRMYLNAAWAVMSIDCVLVLFLGYLIVRTILQLVLFINDPTTAGMSSKKRRRNRSWRQMNLIEVTARVALICCISLLSSLLVQLMWLIMEETENWRLIFISCLWSVDAVINMLCVYFSMAFAKKHYQFVCGKICKCHNCCLWCILKIVSNKADTLQETELGATGDHRNRTETIDVADVYPIPVQQLDSASTGSHK